MTSDAEREAAIRAEHKPDPKYGNAAVPVLLRQLDAARAEIAEWERIMRNAERVLVGQVKLAETRAEAAEARVAELESALRPFARFAEGFGPHAREDGWVLANNVSRTKQITMGDVRSARRALAKDPPR